MLGLTFSSTRYEKTEPIQSFLEKKDSIDLAVSIGQTTVYHFAMVLNLRHRIENKDDNIYK